jgi:hypothetical protein
MEAQYVRSTCAKRIAKGIGGQYKEDDKHDIQGLGVFGFKIP